MVTITYGISTCKLTQQEFLKILNNTAIENETTDLLYRILDTKQYPFSLAKRIRFLESLKNDNISNEAQAKIIKFILQKV